MKKQIPNIVTICNLLCGVIATFFAAQGQLFNAGVFILLGIFFDFFDGLAARLLHVTSDVGKELDSLADVVTSGVAPSLILYNILNAGSLLWLKYVALLTPALAAYRLAKFNLDERQHHGSFLGLPAPANAIIWTGLAFAYELTPDAIIFNNIGLIVIAVISIATAILMVCEMPMFSLKFNFKELSWKQNNMRYIFLIGCLCIIIVCVKSIHICLTLFILWYIILSLLTQKKNADAKP